MRTEVKQEWMDGLSPDGEHSDVSSESVSPFICVCHYHWDLGFFVILDSSRAPSSSYVAIAMFVTAMTIVIPQGNIRWGVS